MKTRRNIIKTLIFSFITIVVFSIPQALKAQPGVSISFQQFYDELSPYGEWVNDSDYGYIWIPNVAPDFQPYASNGNWIMTDYGNTWVSNYQWGWAPFHYGRWNHHRRYGWYWVPGYEWGPAWVSWRSGGGYYGWAPLGPGVNIGVSINIPTNFWVFVPQRYLLSSRIHRYYTPRRTVVNVYNHTTVINNIYVRNNRRYVAGPHRSDIQRITRTSVPVRRISTSSRPGSARISNRSVEIYRPNISRNTKARPSRITSASNIRPSTTRSASSRANSADNASRRTTTGARSKATTRSSTTTRANSTPSRTNSANAKRPEHTTRSRSNTESRPTVNRSTRGRTESNSDNRTKRAVPSRPSVQSRQSGQSRSSVQSRPSRSRQSNSGNISRARENSARPSRSTRD